MQPSCHNSTVHHPIFADNPNHAPVGRTEQITARVMVALVAIVPLVGGPSSPDQFGAVVSWSLAPEAVQPILGLGGQRLGTTILVFSRTVEHRVRFLSYAPRDRSHVLKPADPLGLRTYERGAGVALSRSA